MNPINSVKYCKENKRQTIKMLNGDGVALRKVYPKSDEIRLSLNGTYHFTKEEWELFYKKGKELFNMEFIK